MTKFTLTATHSSGAVATRRTERDYEFAAVRADGSASFHFEFNAAVAAANRFGGEVVPAVRKGKTAKPGMTAEQAITALTAQGFVPMTNDQVVAGGVLRGFIKNDVIADLFIGHEGELKGDVLLLSKRGNRSVRTGTSKLAELEALLAAG